MKSAITAALVALIVIAANPSAAESKLKSTDLPAAVTQLISAQFPGATIEQVTREIENGVEVFDVETEDGNTDRDFIFALDGALLEIGEEIKVSELPAAVASAISAAFPQGKIEVAERKNAGGIISYEVELEDSSGNHELRFTPEGAPLPAEADDDESNEDDDE